MGLTLSTSAPVRTRRLSPPAVPPLENGDSLEADEFLRRYEAMPEKVKAELIEGIVYMASPVRAFQHGEPDSLLQTWLGVYAIATPGVRAATNTTLRLGPKRVPQPDGLLRIRAECGGICRVDDTGLLTGPAELVAEVAASSASIDTRAKLVTYRRGGVREYLVWQTEGGSLQWWAFDGDAAQLLKPAADGVLRSEVFPGLWLDADALLTDDGPRVLAVLNEGLRSPGHAACAATLRGRLEAANR